MELVDVAPGLWIWRLEHPEWAPHVGWPPTVTSTVAESRGEVAVLDPLAPPDDAEVWARLDARPPTLAVVLKPDHVRDVDLFVRRYGARAFGPALFWPTNIPETELEPIEPGRELPGAARPPRPAVRARDRRPRRAGARPSRLRARARASALRLAACPHVSPPA